MRKYLNFSERSTSRALIAQLVSLALIVALATPAFAVIFTNPAAITVNDATAIGTGNPYPANIAVSGLTGTTTNVTVTLSNLNHTFPTDLDIMLVAPGGNNLLLMSDVGGSDDALNTTITFDDGAAASLPAATKLLSGTFKPTNSGTGDTFPAPAPAPSANTTLAAAFNGIDPNGTWSLYVVDDLGVDMGVIGNGWSITVTTGSTATTFTNGAAIHSGDGVRGRATPYASTITASGLTGAITDINVTLTNINHLNPDDLDIMLIGPSGKRILLLSDAGGATDVINQTLTFDDAAAAGVPDAGPLVTATVRPTNVGGGDTLPDLLPPYVNSATAGTATLASVFNGTEGNGTWRLFIVDDATVTAGSDVAGGWSIDITAGGTYGAKRFTNSDFNGDGETDVSIYRSSDSNWWLRSSSAYANSVTKWGTTSDVPVPSDYDGDGKTDIAVFRPSNGTWIVLNSATSTASFTPWGASTDKVVPADYDGDGKADVAIWRDSTATFWVRQSSNSATRIVQWGVSGDTPVRGHFEGTNGADFTVFRPSTGTWYILNNAASSSRQQPWGVSTDKVVAGDYDADTKTDIAVFRPSEGNWYILLSSTGAAVISHWGQNGDTPVPGDYDGDSKVDLAIWRGTDGGWYIANSGTPFGVAAIRIDSWGIPTDIALPATYLP